MKLKQRKFVVTSVCVFFVTISVIACLYNKLGTIPFSLVKRKGISVQSLQPQQFSY